MARPDYPKSLHIALFGTAALALAACGNTNDVGKVTKAVKTLNPGSSRTSCAKAGTTKYNGKRETLYRCSIETEVGIRAMRPQASCFVYVDGNVVDVTRRVGRC